MLTRGQGTDSARLKLARADEHLAALYADIEGWSTRDPCHIVHESSHDGHQHRYRLRLDPPAPTGRWAVLLGDALHNLRCALDHVVYSIAVHETGKSLPDDDSRLAFPICSDKRHFDEAAKRRLRSLSVDSQAAIEKAQPYNRAKRGTAFEPLWWLAGLNDVDKHRLSMVLPIAAEPDSITLGAAPDTFQVLRRDGAWTDGDEFLIVDLTHADPNPALTLRMTGAVAIQTVGQPPVGAVQTLGAIRREVLVVCRYLSHRFI